MLYTKYTKEIELTIKSFHGPITHTTHGREVIELTTKRDFYVTGKQFLNEDSIEISNKTFLNLVKEMYKSNVYTQNTAELSDWIEYVGIFQHLSMEWRYLCMINEDFDFNDSVEGISAIEVTNEEFKEKCREVYGIENKGYFYTEYIGKENIH